MGAVRTSAQASTRARNGESVSSRTTVLVVDDEDLDRTQTSQLLKAHGYSVLEAESYTAAIAVFDRNRTRIQFLVADISLPDGNGCALAIALRERRPDLRVLFVSGHVGAEVCKYYGVDVADVHFLRKPFSGSQLVKLVDEVLKAGPSFP